jgi:hypothetical protein
MPFMHSSPREFANKLGTMEPLIWKKFKTTHAYIARSELRYALDLVVVNPDIISSMLGENKDFDREVMRTVRLYTPAVRLSSREAQSVVNFVYFAITKAGAVSCHLAKAERLAAVYPVRNLTFGRSRTLSDNDIVSAMPHDDLINAVWIF